MIIEGIDCSWYEQCIYYKALKIIEERLSSETNAKDCEQYSSDNTCCNCQNAQWWKISNEFKEYKASKQASYETMQTEWNNAILENRELKKVLKEVVAIAKEYNYWDANLRTASDVIYQIKDKCSEVLNESNI